MRKFFQRFRQEPKAPLRGIGHNPTTDDPLVKHIYFAGAFLGVMPKKELGEAAFVADVASALLHKVKNTKQISGSLDAIEFIDGIFLVCTCNVYTSHMGISFEQAATASLVRRFGMNDSSKISDSIQEYNLMLRERDDSIRMIFSTVKEWTLEPTTQKTEKLGDLYSLLVKSVRIEESK